MLERIEAAVPAMPPSEQRVARLLLGDAQEFARLSVVELAQRSSTSTTSVMRFSRRVGYKGLTDLKKRLLGLRHDGIPYVHRCADIHDRTADVFVKVLDDTVASLLGFRNCANIGNIDAAVGRILTTRANCSRLVFYGIGASATVAQDGQHRFMRLGLNSLSFHDAEMQVISACHLAPADTVIAVSAFGESRELLSACTLVKASKATLVSITRPRSSLTLLSDLDIAIDTPDGLDEYIPTVSRIIHSLIIDVLFTCTAIRLAPSSLSTLRGVQERLVESRNPV